MLYNMYNESHWVYFYSNYQVRNSSTICNKVWEIISIFIVAMRYFAMWANLLSKQKLSWSYGHVSQTHKSDSSWYIMYVLHIFIIYSHSKNIYYIMIIHISLYILNISKARHGQEFAIYLPFLKQKDDKQWCSYFPERFRDCIFHHVVLGETLRSWLFLVVYIFGLF